jgi:hypothetical protein
LNDPLILDAGARNRIYRVQWLAAARWQFLPLIAAAAGLAPLLKLLLPDWGLLNNQAVHIMYLAFVSLAAGLWLGPLTSAAWRTWDLACGSRMAKGDLTFSGVEMLPFLLVAAIPFFLIIAAVVNVAGYFGFLLVVGCLITLACFEKLNKYPGQDIDQVEKPYTPVKQPIGLFSFPEKRTNDQGETSNGDKGGPDLTSEFWIELAKKTEFAPILKNPYKYVEGMKRKEILGLLDECASSAMGRKPKLYPTKAVYTYRTFYESSTFQKELLRCIDAFERLEQAASAMEDRTAVMGLVRGLPVALSDEQAWNLALALNSTAGVAAASRPDMWDHDIKFINFMEQRLRLHDFKRLEKHIWAIRAREEHSRRVPGRVLPPEA